MSNIRKRVLLLLDFFPHYRGPLIKEILEESSHDWILAGDLSDPYKQERIKEWEIPAGTNFLRFPFIRIFQDFGWQRGSLSTAFRRDIDVIIFHANWHILSLWIAAPLARLMGKRVLFYCMGWYRKHPWYVRWMLSLFYKIPHGLCLYGRWAKMQGVLNGYDHSRLHVVYNSLDYKKQRALRLALDQNKLIALREKFFGTSDVPVAIRTGRLIPRAKIEQLFYAANNLAKKGKPLNILLVGEGPEKARLKKLAEDLSLKVYFYGSCYKEEDLAELIGLSSMTVSPGMTGLTSIHSCAYGTPVITHDDPWNQMPEWEIVHEGVSGSFHKHEDLGTLITAIEKWMDPVMPTYESRERCSWLLEKIYNSRTRRRAFDWAVAGNSANDLFYLYDKEGELTPFSQGAS